VTTIILQKHRNNASAHEFPRRFFGGLTPAIVHASTTGTERPTETVNILSTADRLPATAANTTNWEDDNNADEKSGRKATGATEEIFIIKRDKSRVLLDEAEVRQL